MAVPVARQNSKSSDVKTHKTEVKQKNTADVYHANTDEYNKSTDVQYQSTEVQYQSTELKQKCLDMDYLKDMPQNKNCGYGLLGRQFNTDVKLRRSDDKCDTEFCDKNATDVKLNETGAKSKRFKATYRTSYVMDDRYVIVDTALKRQSNGSCILMRQLSYPIDSTTHPPKPSICRQNSNPATVMRTHSTRQQKRNERRAMELKRQSSTFGDRRLTELKRQSSTYSERRVNELKRQSSTYSERRVNEFKRQSSIPVELSRKLKHTTRKRITKLFQGLFSCVVSFCEF